MQPLLLFFVAFYILLMPILFVNWLRFFRGDLDLTKSEKRLSRLAIAIAAVLWPFVVPFAYLELLGKIQRSEHSLSHLSETLTSSAQPYSTRKPKL